MAVMWIVFSEERPLQFGGAVWGMGCCGLGPASQAHSLVHHGFSCSEPLQ